MIEPIERLLTALNYRFVDIDRLQEALTHRSAPPPHNERLEFLGDSLLNCVIADALFVARPRASEGELSRLRASLVNEDTLAELARTLKLGNYLRMGTGELKSGGFNRDSVLADALEAIIGAIYLDGGFTSCRNWVLQLYSRRLTDLPSADQLKDPKTRLQEFLQANQQTLPSYQVLEVSGEDHAQQFRVECTAGPARAVAVGSSRRKAEQEAARQVLESLT